MAAPFRVFECRIRDVSFGSGVTVVEPVNLFKCAIGDDCFIGHGVMFVNDLFSEGGPARGRMDLWKLTGSGNHVSIGSNATILPMRICGRVVIGAGSVVTRDIDRPDVYAGNPARRLRPL